MVENAEIKRLLTDISVRNSQSAYKELFVRLHFRLKQFAYSILKSQEDAEELVSDVFIRIWEKRESLSVIETPRLYFYTMVKNLALTRVKRKKRQVSTLGDDWLIQMDSIYFNPERLMITEEILRQVRAAIHELPPRCRLIFKLVKEDGLRYREVAELLHLSLKTIEAQMAIAFRRIGKCMHLEINPSPLPLKEKKS